MAGFDGVANIYRVLESAAFGGVLQRARLVGLDHLRSCREILILGDGDGRFVDALLNAHPDIRVDAVDDSARMQALASARLNAKQRSRVSFICGDARRFDPGPRRYDAIVTMFFLDCFVDADVAALVSRFRAHLRPGGQWLLTDFDVPPRGLARLQARAVVWGLYRFFRWSSDIQARRLPPSEAILQRKGFICVDAHTFRAGLIRSTVWRLPDGPDPARVHHPHAAAVGRDHNEMVT